MSAPKGSASSSPLAGRRVLLGVTGGIAAYKSAFLTRLLVSAGAEVQVVMTEAATRFVGTETFSALSGRPARTSLWEEPGSVLHVRLAHEADIAVVAPATANTLARLAAGLADDLLSATLLEATCPVVLAPAMHTGMLRDAATQDNMRVLAARGMTIVGPAIGALAAGDEGPGRMEEPQTILAEIESVLARGRDLAGVRLLVTAGPTWEALDPVRFIGNRSTGKMGFAIVEEALSRGASVRLVLGPGTSAPPDGADVVEVTSAQEMRDAVMAALGVSDAVVMAAAVADFRPEASGKHKLKKEEGVPEVRLVRTPDILREITGTPGDRYVVGFAAETRDLETAGRGKLDAKGADLMVVNEVGREGTGFGSDTNDAMILSRDGDDEPLRSWSKRDLARAICDRIAKSRS